jgi:hypothetical protein
MKHKKLTIKHFEDCKLAEIYQSVSIKFAFLTSPKNGTARCHTYVKCRDFLHDALRTQISGTVSSVFSFRFDKKVNPPIDLRYMRMLVKSDAAKTSEEVAKWDTHMLSGLRLLNHYEKLANKPLSTVVRLTNEPVATWLFTGSSFWLKTPYLASMYTFLIRLGVRNIEFQTDEELQEKYKQIADAPTSESYDNDKKYLKSCWDKLSKVIINRVSLFGDGWDKIYNAGTSINSFHNNSGIVSLCKGITCDPELNKRVVECLK